MNVLFACGGTGGHINPAIAVANIWKERHPDSNILFVGGMSGMEEMLIPKAGFDLICMHADGFDRRKNWEGIKNNLRAVSTNLKALRKCRKIILEFKPDIIVGTGGYASFPALLCGAMMKIPTCVHESNAMPGMTTRMLAKWADKVLVCFPDCKKFYKDPDKLEVVGMPIRREFIYTKKEDARKELGLGDKPLVVSAFGSQGAKAMNEAVAELFLLEQEMNFPFHHIHATGSMGWEWMPSYTKNLGVDTETTQDIEMLQYIHNMPTLMAAADVFISRAGASSCNEIAASGTPCILIPSPNVTDNHQEKNARVLADRDAAVLVLEKDCTARELMDQIQNLLADRERYNRMSATLQSMVIPDCAERVCKIMEQLIANKE